MHGAPINIDDLVHARSVEDNRREFKATWDDSVKESDVRTVCAFANDLLNLNGGYVFSESTLTSMVILYFLHVVLVTRISTLFREKYLDSAIAFADSIRVWAPGGDNRLPGPEA